MSKLYLELAEKARELQAEYEREKAKLEPLRIEMTRARIDADAEWRRMIYAAQTASHQ